MVQFGGTHGLAVAVNEAFGFGDRLVDHAGEGHHAEAVADTAERFTAGSGVS